jgi:hypothetical protein
METQTQSPEVKAVIGFGTKSALAGATPKAIQFFYRALMFLGGLWALVIEPQFPKIPVEVIHNIDKWILIGNALIYYICQFFGWVIPKNAAAQTTQV